VAAGASPGPGRLRGRIGDVLQQAWISGGALSTALLPLSWAFEAATAVRRSLHANGLSATHSVPARVVVIGNLLVGGAGKTPTVIAVVALLRRHGWTPAIVSRGYGRKHDEVREVATGDSPDDVGDEPLLLARRTGVPVVVGRDRVAAAHAVLQAYPTVDVLVSDDGLQHLALARDVEVLVFDERGLGNGRLLPAGPLRERLGAGRGAARLVLYNATAATAPVAGFVGRRSLSGVAPLDAWQRGEAPTIAALEALRGRPMLAAAGLARPGRFFAMLRERGLDIAELPLPDHHDFRVLPWPPATPDVVITEKDAVKIDASRRIGTRVWVAALDFAPEPAFDDALLGLLPHDRPTSVAPHGNPPA
jgi:tetraacyldisaccharide 4'-kinase